MKVLILCGGLGTRLRPHTLTRPKALLNVAGRPVLSHILDKLLELAELPRFRYKLEFIFVIGYLGEQITAYVQTEYITQGRLRARFVEQPRPLGSSDAVLQAREAIFADEDDPAVLLVYSDTLFETNLDELTDVPTELAGTICWREVEDVRPFGAIVLDDATGYVARLVEKPQTFVSNLAVVSPYYFTSARQLYAAIAEQYAHDRKTKGEFYLTDAMQLMLEGGAKFRPQRISHWLDTGTVDNLLESNRALLDLQNESGVRRVGSSLVIEPCFIAGDVQLENSIVGPHVSIASGASIRDSLVRDCIIENGAQIASISLRASIIGRNAIVEGHSFEKLNLGDYNQTVKKF